MTKHEQAFEVVKKTKPNDYVYTPTEVKCYEKLEEDITQLETDIKKIATDISEMNGTLIGKAGTNNKAELFNAAFEASGAFAHAEGNNTTASGVQSHAEGINTTAKGAQSHIEGFSSAKFVSVPKEFKGTVDYWKSLINENKFSLAEGYSSHVEGSNNIATNYHTHAEGCRTIASNTCAHSEGLQTEASGTASHAEGSDTKASGDHAHAEGLNTFASGHYSHAEGRSYSKYNGDLSADKILEGWQDIKEKDKRFSMAFGNSSHVEGENCLALKSGAHAEGSATIADYFFAHAEGELTTANGEAAHAEGYKTAASGMGSHAEGHTTKASRIASHAEGYCTIALGDSQHVQGQYNLLDNGRNAITTSKLGKYAHIVGNGINASHRSNAYTLDWSGNAWYQGTVESAGIILTSPNGTKYYISVDDTGTLNVVPAATPKLEAQEGLNVLSE